MSRYDAVECDAHATMVVGAAIEYVSSCVVGYADERIIRCRLLIVPVSSPLGLRHSKQYQSDNYSFELDAWIRLAELISRMRARKRRSTQRGMSPPDSNPFNEVKC